MKFNILLLLKRQIYLYIWTAVFYSQTDSKFASQELHKGMSQPVRIKVFKKSSLKKVYLSYFIQYLEKEKYKGSQNLVNNCIKLTKIKSLVVQKY